MSVFSSNIHRYLQNKNLVIFFFYSSILFYYLDEDAQSSV